MWSSLLLFASLASSLVLPRDQPTVKVGKVTFTGSSANDVESFLNIRFGEDTSGNNRFAAPKAFTYKDGTKVDASQPGAACPQAKVPIQGISFFDNVTNVSEDCLTLRVDRPAKGGSKLPVMVYIYGGGDTIGQIYDSAYNPTGLVTSAADKGYPIIYVAMNYRLGLFGFAAGPTINSSDLNAGLQDQRLGLEWVQQNIESFGGDPDDVTIFGESDGATGVGLQCLAYGKNDNAPFKRAIMESGAATADKGTASNFTANNTASVISLAKCSSGNPAAELSCMRKLPLSTLLPIAINFELQQDPFGGLDVFIPTAPSDFIPDAPSKLLKQGKFAHGIDMLAGWNEDDGSLFTPPPQNITSDADIEGFLQFEFPGISSDSIQKAMNLYPVSDFSGLASENVSAQWFRASRMSRDSGFTCPALLQVHMNMRYSLLASNYLFVLNQTMFTPLYAAANQSFLGVSHFSDIPFVFNQAQGKYKAIATSDDVKLASEISGSWASFANYGDPSRGKDAVSGWRHAMPLDPEAGDLPYDYNVEIIGGPNAGVEKTGGLFSNYEMLEKRCLFWNSDELLNTLEV